MGSTAEQVTAEGTVLRGAAVAVDVRRAARALATAGLAVLAVLVAALFWAGVRHNSRMNSLRKDGVAVTATVSQCRGLMGGSGSNAAGYECTGTFSLGGHRYQATLPDGLLHAAGSRVAVVTVPGDPALVATPAAVASERPSATVFVAPAALVAVLLVLSGAVVAVTRSAGYTARSRRALRSTAPTAP